jgi:hypothetical protein
MADRLSRETLETPPPAQDAAPRRPGGQVRLERAPKPERLERDPQPASEPNNADVRRDADSPHP